MNKPGSQPSHDGKLESASFYLLEGLLEIGVDYIFANLGTDHAPIIEELALWRARGLKAPTVILVPHENVAVHMAAGFTLMTGRSQAIFVHVDTGTANSAMALHNLFRWRVPALLMAGVAPFTSFGEHEGSRDTYVHFIQQPFDQASVVRPYVKWEYTLPSGSTTQETLRRVHTVMNSDPKGPAYLMLPREILTQRVAPSGRSRFSADRSPPLAAAGADPHTIAVLADKLLASQNPVLLTSYAGRDPLVSSVLVRLAELTGIRVIDFLSNHNINWEFPEFGGFKPDRLDLVDFGLLVDIEVPWIPLSTKLNDDTFWAQVDVDPIKSGSPLWPFPTHLRIQGRSGRVLEQLIAELERRATAEFHAASARRRSALIQQRLMRQVENDRLAADPGQPNSINVHHFSAQLGRVLKDTDIVVNEAVTSQSIVAMHVPRPRPGTMISNPGGGLGASGGVALGVKLANPDSVVVQVVGDGTFYFNNPTAVFAVAKDQNLPILTIVLDNGGWGAVKGAVDRVHPGGTAYGRDEYLSVLPVGMNFAKIVEAAGGYGERITDPANIASGLENALKAVAEGRSALLHVTVKKH